jgi:hypothetical protein
MTMTLSVKCEGYGPGVVSSGFKPRLSVLRLSTQIILPFILPVSSEILKQLLQSRKNAVFWDVTPCGSCKNRRFGGT